MHLGRCEGEIKKGIGPSCKLQRVVFEMAYPIFCLTIRGGIKVEIVKNDGIRGGGEIDTKATGSCREEENEYGTILRVSSMA